MSLSAHHDSDAPAVNAQYGPFNTVLGDQYNYILACEPCLEPAASSYNGFVSIIQKAQTSGAQLNALAGCAYDILQTLDDEYRVGNLVEPETSASLEKLNSLLHHIFIFVQSHADYDFVKSLCTKDQVERQIKEYHSRISVLMNAFQISKLVNIHRWQLQNETTRKKDQETLHQRFNELEANHGDLAKILDQTHNTVMAVSVSLQKLLNKTTSGDRERKFFPRSIQFLATSSGHRVKLQSWMITSLEVEFGREIGRGGFGRVFEGRWDGREVALKVLRTDDGGIPTSEAICREVDTWSKLRHPHILEFIGANVLDQHPFIVMPLLKNGNARDYVPAHRDFHIIRLLYHVSLGLEYLHSEGVVHGDLKALNILINDNGKAVLCDFGLSRVRVDVPSRVNTTVNPTIVLGSPNWMAPERLQGQTLSYPCDIYSFGMTSYEIYANATPWCDISIADIHRLVVDKNMRPQRPQHDEAPQLTDEVWELVEFCWVKNPHKRPTASAICATLSRLRTEIGNPSHLRWPHSNPPDEPQPDFQLGGQRGRVKRLNLQWSRGALTAVRSVAFSPDGTKLASSHRNGVITIWNAPTGTAVRAKIRGHESSVHSIAFSCDGGRIVSGSGDKTIHVWDAVTGESVLGPLTGHKKCVTSVALSPDGEHIMSGSKDGTIRFWSAKTGEVILVSGIRNSSSVTSVAFFPRGSWAVAGSSELELWKWNKEKKVWQWKEYPAESFQEANTIRSMAFSPNGEIIVCGSGTNIQVWDSETGHLRMHLNPGNKDPINCVAISPDAKLIVSGSHNSTFMVWDVDTGNPVARKDSIPSLLGRLKGANTCKEVYSITISPDNKSIAVGTTSDLELYSYI